jgi:glycosyltransferase involved in cell wall biosynthesis
MKPLRILVDSLADAGLTNAQMSNAREIIRRLNPELFHVTTFCLDAPDPSISSRSNTRIIRLPRKKQTARILWEFIFGKHEILFYLKASPASKMYMGSRRAWRNKRVTIGTIESQSDLRNEPTIGAATIHLWEQTVLRADHLFSNSATVKESLFREYGLLSEIVPTGVDTAFFTPAATRPVNSRAQVLFAGSLRPFKQPQLLLEAAARYPNADFVLAGDGEMKNELAQRIQQEKLTNVRMLGGQTAEQLRELYRASDIFLFPSLWEGSPKVLLEAAACGLPIVARHNYRPETVIDGETGYLVASDSELFLRLETLLADPGLCRKLGTAGRKHSEAFSWDIIARQWQEIFLQLRPGRRT